MPYPRVLIEGEDVPAAYERPYHDEAPAVIFGGRSKLRADGPYLDLLREFVSALTGTEDLVVVGYSFRDDHVNEVVRTWLGTNPTARTLGAFGWRP